MPLFCLIAAGLLALSDGGNVYTLRALALEYTADSLVDGIVGDLSRAAADPPAVDVFAYSSPAADPALSPSPAAESPDLKTPVPDGMKPIVKRDLSGSSLFINTTKYALDPAALREASDLSPVSGSDPLVLVVHTHGTEAFYRDGGWFDPDRPADGWYDPHGESPRSSERSENVVGVGDEFCAVLEASGIPTLHCDVLHDVPDFNSSYSHSYASVTSYLKKYPSIKYVVDIHRDSIIKDNGEKLRPFTVIDSLPCAQVMLVMGTDESGYSHPDWRVNMGNALLYKDTMDALYPGLARPIYVRTVRFNQHVATGAMLLEVGSCGNTFEEAKNAAHFAALALAALIRSA